MSQEENLKEKTSHGSHAVVIETVSSKTAPINRPMDHTAGEAAIPSQKLASTKPSERYRHVARNLSTAIQDKRRDAIATAIPMTTIETDTMMDEVVVVPAPTQPKAALGKEGSPIPGLQRKVKEKESEDMDSITSEIKELRSPDVSKKFAELIDAEEASGLPRLESRASRTSRSSRVSRVVRQIFCCGLQIDAPSEDNVSSPRDDIFHTGI